MAPIVLLTLAALVSLPYLYHEADTKRYEWRTFIIAFVVYSVLLVGAWICAALPVLLWMKG
jgi:nitrate reductase NapE component